jgi:hypothetical protein
MTFPLPLTLEIACARTLYLDLTLGLGFNFFIKVCGHTTLVNRHSYDKISLSELFFLCTFTIPLCQNFSYVEALCAQVFHWFSFHVLPFLFKVHLYLHFNFVVDCSKPLSPQFLFYIKVQSMLKSFVCVKKKIPHWIFVLSKFFEHFCFDFSLLTKSCPFLFRSWISRRSFLVYFRKHIK